MASASDSASAPSVVFNGGPALRGGGGGGCRDSCAEHMVIQSRVDDAAQHVLNAIHTDSRLNGDGIACARHDSVKACDDNGRDILRAICDSDSNCVDTTRQVGDALRDAIERNGDNTVNSVERNADMLSALISDTRNSVNQNGRDILLASKDLALQVCKAESVLARQASDNAGSVKLELLKTQNALERQASDNACAIKLDAHKNKEELFRQMTECCCEFKERLATVSCELKTTVYQSAEKTQNLIQQEIIQGLRDRLATANQTILTDQAVARTLGLSGLPGGPVSASKVN
jgi:hypothetical protein